MQGRLGIDILAMAHIFVRGVAVSTLLVSLLSISPTEGADPPAAQPAKLRLVPIGQEPTAEQNPQQQNQAPADPALPTTEVKVGTSAGEPCVLLRNNNVLFGDAVQQGDQVLIRRDDGSEIRLPWTKVACWAKSVRDLYQYRLDHRRGGDLAVHLDDARWCLRYELLDLAAEEIRHVYAIEPDNSEANRIESRIRYLASAQRNVQTSQAKVQPVDYEQETQTEEGDPSEEPTEPHQRIDARWLRQFAGQVQPTLINRCGQCHADSLPQAWRLSLPALGTRASARITSDNLAATIAYIDVESPSDSELLLKATTAHGGGPAPLGSRNANALDALQAWVQAVPASSFKGQTRDRRDNRRSGSDSYSSEIDNAAIDSVDSDNAAQEQQHPAVGLETEGRGSATKIVQPSRLPQVANPFDPDLFNRRFHQPARDN